MDAVAPTGTDRQLNTECKLKTITKLENAQRVEYARQLITSSLTPTEQQADFKKKYSLSRRSVFRYFALAREQALADLRKPREEWQAEQVDFYRSIARNPLHKAADRIAAGKCIDAIKGTRQPKKIESVGGVTIDIQKIVVNGDQAPAPVTVDALPPEAPALPEQAPVEQASDEHTQAGQQITLSL